MIDVTIRIVASDDSEFSQRETEVLTALAGTAAATDAPAAPVESEAAPEAPTPARAPRKPRQTRSTRAAVLEDTEEQPPEEPPAAEEADDVLGDGAATLEEAVALATDAVSNGKKAKVRVALEAAGAAKVRDLEGDQIQVFVDEMNK